MKMIQVTYHKAHRTEDWKQLIIDDDKEQMVLMNIDHIATVSPNAVKGLATDKNGTTLVDLHYLRTTIPYNNGTGGIDYCTYWVTEDTYKKLIMEAFI